MNLASINITAFIAEEMHRRLIMTSFIVILIFQLVMLRWDVSAESSHKHNISELNKYSVRLSHDRIDRNQITSPVYQTARFLAVFAWVILLSGLILK